MILLVPISPEVPKHHRPRFWPSFLMVAILGLIYLETLPILRADTKYVENIENYFETQTLDQKTMQAEAERYLRKRPLLKIAPARGDWNLKRLLFANFVHGSTMHLTLNCIGLFAGIRICTTFLPFLCSLAIFILGGSLGLFVSLFASNQFTHYIPHVGASAGIFALMGAYYIYNLRFRTSYFFWFPSRRGFISLKTSWFFFIDVILLEILLSATQFFPERLDSVDHIAHVVGFATGVVLAMGLRTVQRWPSFLQTRGEFLYWANFFLPRYRKELKEKTAGQPTLLYKGWMEMLQMNRYNDLVKIRLCRLVGKEQEHFSDAEIAEVFRFLVPTFVRLHTDEVAHLIRVLLRKRRTLPQRWLTKTPYDILIRLARVLATPLEEQHLLYRLVLDYRKAHANRSAVDRKLELLMQKLEAHLPEEMRTTLDTGSSSLKQVDEVTRTSVEAADLLGTEEENAALPPDSKPNRAGGTSST